MNNTEMTVEDIERSVELLERCNDPPTEGHYKLHIRPELVQLVRRLTNRLKYRGGRKVRSAERRVGGLQWMVVEPCEKPE